jgi:hypothetical protein
MITFSENRLTTRAPKLEKLEHKKIIETNVQTPK